MGCLMNKPTNTTIADALDQLADRLAEREANPHRVQAYRFAAQSVRQAERPLADLLEEGGVEGLKNLPGVGDSLASRIAGFIETGRLQLLERLRDEFSPALFTRVPGIGRELAKRIYDALGVETLEELEMAAYDGRLEQVEGFGRRRVRALRAQLHTMLGRRARRRAQRYHPASAPAPSVAMLLNVDLEYRYRNRQGELRLIAPRRFNPEDEAWLPVLNTRRGAWRFTAMFSNTARAHELGKTDDWVVIYAESEGVEHTFTVVTETRGPLQGRRIVRGQEAACAEFYAQHAAQAA